METNEVMNAKTKKFNAPKSRNFTGIIADVELANGSNFENGEDRIRISVNEIKGNEIKTHSFLISKNAIGGEGVETGMHGLNYGGYFSLNLLQVDKVFDFTIDETIEGQTEYQDADGEVRKHKNTGELLRAARPISGAIANALINKYTRIVANDNNAVSEIKERIALLDSIFDKSDPAYIEAVKELMRR